MLLALGLGHISLVLAYFDGLTSGLAAVGVGLEWSAWVHARICHSAWHWGPAQKAWISQLGARSLGIRVSTSGGRSTGSNLLVLDTDRAALSGGVGSHVA
jgi:hypothetical protein